MIIIIRSNISLLVKNQHDKCTSRT